MVCSTVGISLKNTAWNLKEILKKKNLWHGWLRNSANHYSTLTSGHPLPPPVPCPPLIFSSIHPCNQVVTKNQTWLTISQFSNTNFQLHYWINQFLIIYESAEGFKWQVTALFSFFLHGGMHDAMIRNRITNISLFSSENRRKWILF